MAYTKLKPHLTSSARVDEISKGSSHYLLTIHPGEADKYRLAQLDDYALTSRRQFPHRSPLTLVLSGRTSSDSIPGTWGFGFWNHPFGLSLGFGGNPFQLPALPNAVWFFGASKENYLSFRTERNEEQTKRGAANGFMAQSFRSPKFHPLLVLAGLAFPFSRRTTRRLMSRVIAEDGIQLGVDPTQWHRYRLQWSPKRVVWEVDDVRVFESAVSPNPPLGLVIWIDNQYAAFTPEGKLGFGVLQDLKSEWLEIREIELA